MSRLPKQNRVVPNGEIVADSHRGMWMRNRGVLHDAGQQVIRPYLWWQSALHPWTFAGYETAVAFSVEQSVVVLTPRSITQLLHFGYTPQVHPSVLSYGRN